MSIIQLIPLHTKVAGRIRVKIKGSDLDWIPLIERLGQTSAIKGIKINYHLGTMVVDYDETLSVSQILVIIAGQKNWETLSPAQSLAQLNTTAHGLTNQEAHHRLSVFGENQSYKAAAPSFSLSLLAQLNSLPVLLLLASSGVSFVSKAHFEGLALLSVVGVNALIGATSELNASRVIRTLDVKDYPDNLVIRSGVTLIVAPHEIVQGDIIVLSQGTRVPADIRLLKSKQLYVDESLLTGESFPFLKDENASDLRGVMVWQGTLIASGEGQGLVVATGASTALGIMQTQLGATSRPLTPMQRRLDILGKKLVKICGTISAAMAIVGMLRGVKFTEAVRQGAALAVAAIPEGLPTVATLSLGLAVRELSYHGVLVRRLEAIESAASLSTIFFDKTGTLTFNQMKVSDVKVTHPNALAKLWQIATLCSDAEQTDDGYSGSSTEIALLEGAATAGIIPLALRQEYPRLVTSYRSPSQQFMLTTHQQGRHGYFRAVKGSPTQILDLCQTRLGGRITSLTQEWRDKIMAQNHALSSLGLRVIGFAFDHHELDSAFDNLTWVGLVGLSDPARPDASLVIDKLQAGGITCVMLTGDQSETARTLAQSVNICNVNHGIPVAIGDIEALSDEELVGLVLERAVCARVFPHHKLKVINAFRNQGHTVAMVGDGLNDALALKAAHVGVSLGIKASQSAKDLSDLVLRDDNLTDLITLIAHGRNVHKNIRRAVNYMISTNLSEVFIMMSSVLLGLGQPVNAAQLLWINLLTDVLPGLALSRTNGIDMTLPPHVPANDDDYARWPSLFGQATLLSLGPLLIHSLGKAPKNYKASQTATAIIAGQIAHAFKVSKNTNSSKIWLVGAGGITATLQAIALYVPSVRKILGFAPLSSYDLGKILASCMVSVMLEKEGEQF